MLKKEIALNQKSVTKQFIKQWNNLLSSLKHNKETKMISYMDSDLYKMAKLLRDHRNHIPKHNYDKIMNSIEMAVGLIWTHPELIDGIPRCEIKHNTFHIIHVATIE